MTSHVSAAPGSIQQASATAASAARSGSASRAGSSHACQVERATPASRAACACDRFASLRQCLSRPLMVCRYSATPRRLKSGLSVYSLDTPPLKKTSHKIAVRRTTPENRPFCHPSRPYAPPHRAYPFAASPSKPCKKQPRSAPISAAAGHKSRQKRADISKQDISRVKPSARRSADATQLGKYIQSGYIHNQPFQGRSRAYTRIHTRARARAHCVVAV